MCMQQDKRSMQLDLGEPGHLLGQVSSTRVSIADVD